MMGMDSMNNGNNTMGRVILRVADKFYTEMYREQERQQDDDEEKD